MRFRNATALASIAVLLSTLSAVPVQAGCGCDKPPPPLASVRPAFGSPGDTINLFGNFVVGQSYTVTFTSGGTSAAVSGTALVKRDFGDGVMKPQVTVAVPDVPIGPTSITVVAAGATGAAAAPALALDSSAFTTLAIQLALTEDNGETVFQCYQAAVGADGTLYIPLYVAAISQHIVLKGFAQSLPLAFAPGDVTIYNTQGVLMQLLTADDAGIWAIADDKGGGNSFSMLYDRHEFQTYKENHVHEGNLILDPNDPAWHLDGTRHFDHDNLVIAIHAMLRKGTYLTPGASKSFNLDITSALDAGTPGKATRKVSFCH